MGAHSTPRICLTKLPAPETLYFRHQRGILTQCVNAVVSPPPPLWCPIAHRDTRMRPLVSFLTHCPGCQACGPARAPVSLAISSPSPVPRPSSWPQLCLSWARETFSPLILVSSLPVSQSVPSTVDRTLRDVGQILPLLRNLQ